MNSQRRKALLLPSGGETPLEKAANFPQALMVEDVPPREPSEQATLAAHGDARQLVRLVQCPRCSKPFSAPVTLPCGHTVCRGCLPAPRPRANVSYPNTPDRLVGVTCPLSLCGAEHAAAECHVDVTLTKLMELIKAEMAKHKPAFEDTPTLLEEIVPLDENDEKEKMHESGHSRVLHGGRLVSTFTMADMGELSYRSELSYRTLSPSGDEYQHLDAALLERLREVAHKELDCLVCYNMMLDPTTTSCGHTFCRRCLARVMDHSNICPMCRTNLHIPPSLQNKGSNILLNSLLQGLCPDLVAARKMAVETEEQAGDDTLNTPLFVCTLSLPSMPTFLHVFEPRYRLMMRRCWDGNRQFGMVMYNRSSASQGDLGPTQFLEYGTLLEIVNLELLRDGRSFVETRGVGRFRIRAHGMMDGYYVGRVERVEDVSLAEEGSVEQSETAAAQELIDQFRRENPDTPLPGSLALNLYSTQQLLDSCMSFVREMRQQSAPWLSARIVSVYGEPPEDPALFPYWFASVLPIAEEEKYVLLRTTRVRERLKIVYSWIARIRGQRW
jgi:Lon protease-like protein